MTDKKLTKHQQRVLRMLQQDKTPEQISKSLGTTRNNVYGHMRRMRRAGVELPAGKNRSDRGREKPQRRGSQAIPPASTNGKSEALVQIGQMVKDAIGTAERRIAEINDRRKELSAQIEKLGDEDAALAVEGDILGEKREGLSASVTE